MKKQYKIQKDKRSGDYFVRIQVAGKRKYVNLGTSLKEACKNLTRLEKQTTTDESDVKPSAVNSITTTVHQAPCSSPSVMLSELIAIHLKWVRDNRALGTYTNYELFERHLLEFVGDRPVSTITRLMLEDGFSWSKKNHSKSQNGGNEFVRHVKGMFLWAQEMDICPCPVKKFPKTSETPPQTKRFSDEELKTLLNCTWPDSEEFRSMIIFGLHTGLRPKEIRELKRSQIHNDNEGNCTAFIQNHKTARTAHEPKPRSVPLTPVAKAIALKYLAAHPKSEHVFLNARGEPFTRGVFRQRLIRWCKRAGIKPHPPYAMRHTFGSMEAEANINQTIIAQMMGHSQLRTTSRYISNNAAHHRVAVGSIGSRITGLENQ